MQNWLLSIPTLLPPSGCHTSLGITFESLCSSKPLITEVLAFDIYFFFSVLHGMQDIDSMTRC